MTEHYVGGIHAVTALLSSHSRKPQKLFVYEGKINQRLQNLITVAESKAILIEKLSPQIMNHRFAFVHQGIVAITAPPQEYFDYDLPKLLASIQPPALILILDGITDPHNLGACLRTADATGVDFIIIPKDKSVSITSTVSKVACGAAESIPVVKVTNLVRTMEFLKQEGIWIYGAALGTEQTIYQLDCKQPIAFALGAEGEGLRRLTQAHCDVLFNLPMLGAVESLNVSVATGVCLYETVRQRI